MRLPRTSVPLLAALAVVAIVAGVFAVLRHSPPSGPAAGRAGPPPVLRLSGVEGPGPARGGEVVDRVPGAAGGYTLAGTLPTATLQGADAYSLAAPSSSDVRRLAAALGLSDTPRAVDGGWLLDSGGHRLSVRRADGGWSYGPKDCVSAPGTDAATACALAPPTTPTDPRRVTASARRVLAGIGLADADLVVSGPTATARPVVSGRATVGWATTLTYSGPALAMASGSLGHPRTLASYPLISARAAYDRMAARPRLAIELCRVGPDGRGCLPPARMVVTGAMLGLSWCAGEAGPVLVPAWLFTLRGRGDPVAELAVQPKYVTRRDG